MTWSNYNYCLLLIYKLDSVSSGFMEGATKFTSPLVSSTAFLLPPWSFIWPLLTVSVRIMYVCYCVEERTPSGSWFLVTLGSGCWIGLARHGPPSWAFVLLVSGHHTLYATGSFTSACKLLKSLSLKRVAFPLLIHTVLPEATTRLFGTPSDSQATFDMFSFNSVSTCFPLLIIPFLPHSWLIFPSYTAVSHACAFRAFCHV